MVLLGERLGNLTLGGYVVSWIADEGTTSEDVALAVRAVMPPLGQVRYCTREDV